LKNEDGADDGVRDCNEDGRKVGDDNVEDGAWLGGSDASAGAIDCNEDGRKVGGGDEEGASRGESDADNGLVDCIEDGRKVGGGDEKDDMLGGSDDADDGLVDCIKDRRKVGCDDVEGAWLGEDDAIFDPEGGTDGAKLMGGIEKEVLCSSPNSPPCTTIAPLNVTL